MTITPEHLEPSDGTGGLDIELIVDGDGLAVIGPPAAVDRFFASTGVPSRELDLRRLSSLSAQGGAVLQAASGVSANAGRWMKLTDESARAVQHLPLVRNSTTNFVHATTRSPNGQFAKSLQFVAKPGAMLTNPAILAGVGGLMAQYAMQQTMEEITDYLAKIDAKVDDILRAQKDAVFADMIGVEFLLDEAMVVRGRVGRVSEVTWSKLQSSAGTIARTQAYALRQLDALAEKLEATAKVGDLAELAEPAEATTVEWLAVLARCFQLQEGMAIIELDRVLDAAPHELDEHRIGLQAARQRRVELISRTTTGLVARMDAAAKRANAKVLLHPMSSRVVVQASNSVAVGVDDFHGSIGIATDRAAIEGRRWTEAAEEARDDVLEAGADGLQAVGRFGNEALENARMSAGRFAGRLAERLQRTDEPDTTRGPQGEDKELDDNSDDRAERGSH